MIQLLLKSIRIWKSYSKKNGCIQFYGTRYIQILPILLVLLLCIFSIRLPVSHTIWLTVAFRHYSDWCSKGLHILSGVFPGQVDLENCCYNNIYLMHECHFVAIVVCMIAGPAAGLTECRELLGVVGLGVRYNPLVREFNPCIVVLVCTIAQSFCWNHLMWWVSWSRRVKASI